MAPVDKKLLMKAHRERLKADKEKWQQHLNKERERDKKRREMRKVRETEDDELIKERQKAVLARVKKHRKAIKNQTEGDEQVSPIGSYKCSQSFGKAVKRVKNTLPISPRKKAAIVKKLAVEVGLKSVIDCTVIKKPRKGTTALPVEHIQCIKDFYISDPISRQAPGKRDTKSIKCPETGKRVHIQKRNMVMSVKEAFEEFKLKHPEISVKRSCFFSLRPTHVLPFSQMPHNVCVCKYHANLNFILQSISRTHDFFPKNHKELLEYLCCDVSKENCAFGKCSTCSLRKVTDLAVGLELEADLTWKQWTDGKGGIQLTVITGRMSEAIQEIENKISHFKIHCHVKTIQEDYFEKCKKDLEKEDSFETYATVQIDFAENYAITFQDEIQSAHWSHQQVGIFTCCVWLPTNKTKCYAVISNDMTHSKYCVFTFLSKIIQDIKKNYPLVDELKIFSDNCSGQFKSRFTMSGMCKLEKESDLTLQWNFFASSHGKGAVDGIGATVKRHVWMAVKGNRNTHIGNARDFYDYVNEKVTGISSIYVDKSEVLENEILLNNYWENVLKIPQIQSSHHFRVFDSEQILVGKTSSSLMKKVAIKDFSDKSSEASIDVIEEGKSRTRYEDVYTDSDTEDNPASHQFVRMTPIADPEEIHSGMFLLVNVPSLRGTCKGTTYRYAAVAQGSVENDEKCLSVMFLKSRGPDKTTFIADDGDIIYVHLHEVIGKLPNPEVKAKGLFTILYIFENKVDVFERV